jgi:hypothetical protein
MFMFMYGPTPNHVRLTIYCRPGTMSDLCNVSDHPMRIGQLFTNNGASMPGTIHYGASTHMLKMG